MKIIESLRIDSMILANDNRILSERVTARDNVIKQQSDRIDTYKLLMANADKQIANLTKQNDLGAGISKDLKKALKWANAKTTIAGGLALVATVLVIIYK